MGKVILLPVADQQLTELELALYYREYFGFMESALEYVERLKTFIKAIPEQKFKKTTNPRHGQYYCKYKQNRLTTWFFTFDIKDDRFIVKKVINNHTIDYPRFIAGIT